MRKIFTILCIAALAAGFTSCAGNEGTKDERAKYIFLFIGDGMGFSHIAVTESYLSYKVGKLGGESLTMTQFPYFGFATNYSASCNVTDSSAAGTAIAGGEKANNEQLGVNEEEKPVETIAQILEKEGYNIGITSTVAINHATPAAFYAHSTDRYDYYGISQQIVDSGYDFFAGSGFLDYFNEQGENIEDYLKQNGYPIYYGIEEFNNSSSTVERAILCQKSNIGGIAANYESTSKVPGDDYFNEILKCGIEFLGDEEPFFFMCEGGKIDRTAHNNAVMATVMEIIEFDDAIKVALDFYREHPDETLIVVTADHETGGISLGMGERNIDWKKLEDRWIETKGMEKLSRKENYEFSKSARIGWTDRGHTGGHVPVFAIGKGAEKFCGRMDNTEIKGKILCE